VSDEVRGLVIRAASPADAAVVLQFIRSLADYERLAHECHATLEQVQQTLFGERPAAEVVLAWRGAEPVGFALFFPNYSTFLAKPGLFLEDLFVIPAARGAGVGRALLTFLANEAVRRGAGRLEWNVLDWNAPAIGFYESVGARPMSDWTTYRVTGDALTALARAAT
jgi:GNAT superfamily N-acetyltransferase